MEGYIRGLPKPTGINVWDCFNPYSAQAVEWEQMGEHGHPTGWPCTEMSVFEVKEENSVTFLVFKIHYNWPAVGWIQGEIVKRNVWSQDEDWIWHGQLLCFFQIRWWHPQALLNLSNYIKDGSPEAPHSDWVLLVDKEGMRETRVECFDEFTLVFLHMFEWFLFLHILTPETTPHPHAPP